MLVKPCIRPSFHASSFLRLLTIIIQRWVLFHKDLTTKSAGSGSVTVDNSGLGMNCTTVESEYSFHDATPYTVLTCAVDARNKEEAVGRQAGFAVCEEAYCAGRVVEPGERCDPSLRGEREGEVRARRHVDLWVYEVRCSQRHGSELSTSHRRSAPASTTDAERPLTYCSCVTVRFSTCAVMLRYSQTSVAL